MASHSCASEASSLGGKNSKLNVGVSASIIAGMDRVNRSARAIEDAVPCAMPHTLGRARPRRVAAVHGATGAPRRLTTISATRWEDPCRPPPTSTCCAVGCSTRSTGRSPGPRSRSPRSATRRPARGAVSGLLTGGKGLRAGFLYWGYRAAGGADSDALVRLAASMEFFQGAALLHDDVMDRSDTRRGMPSAHRAVASLHQQRGWAGDPTGSARAPRSWPATCASRGATRCMRRAACPARSWHVDASSSTRCARS